MDADAFGKRLDAALRGPLDRIVANAETIRAQADGPLRRDYAAYAADIATAGRHLLALVGDLVDLQAIERPDFRIAPEPIDLADVARRAAGLLGVRAADRGIRIDRPGDDERGAGDGRFPPRAADPRQPDRQCGALFARGRHAVGALRGGRAGDGAWPRSSSPTRARGIAPEDQARIFDKFERVDPSEPGGTGLGLYISRRLARAMGGDITVDSAPGQGARFVLTLPAG